MRGLLVAVLLLAACAPAPAQTPPSPPGSPTGISRDEAIRIATQHVSSFDAHLISATTGQSRPWGPLDHPDVHAWIVRFTGNFPMECPAPTANCPELHNAVIVLDGRTGEFISGTYQ